jgi:hypothetical protein
VQQSDDKKVAPVHEELHNMTKNQVDQLTDQIETLNKMKQKLEDSMKN